MGLGYEYFIQIKTVIADSHYIYIFFFFSNLFILYYYYYSFSSSSFLSMVAWVVSVFGFHNISMMNNVFMWHTQSQKKENPFCKSLRKKKHRKRKTITRITVSFFFSILIYLFICSVEPNYFIFP